MCQFAARKKIYSFFTIRLGLFSMSGAKFEGTGYFEVF